MNKFICIEGVDGVGKTEVSKCLCGKLGYIYYKSPGGQFATIRTLVDTNVDPLTRYFFYRSATQYDSNQIRVLLKSSNVVCDRYIYSTFAFHGAMDPKIISLFESTQLLMPDHTFLLTAREKVRIERLKRRPNTNSLDFNLALQRQATRLFKTFGHKTIDTSDLTVEQTTDLIISQIQNEV